MKAYAELLHRPHAAILLAATTLTRLWPCSWAQGAPAA